MRLTVAICTYDPDEALLGRVLDAAAREVEAYGDAEAIVIDNASDPPLEGRALLRSRPVRVVREPRSGLTAAREAALVAAEGDVVVFCDDDTVLHPGYLRATADAFAAHRDLAVLGGAVIPEYDAAPPAWLRGVEAQLAVRRYAPGFFAATTDPPYTEHFPIGAGMAVRRAVGLEHVRDAAATGRIEGRRGLELSAGEDLDLSLFALSRGLTIAVSGAPRLTHVIPAWRTRPDYLARLAAGSLRSAALLEEKWAPRFGRPIFPVLDQPLPVLLAKTAAAGLLRPASRANVVRYARLRAQVRLRLGAADG